MSCKGKKSGLVSGNKKGEYVHVCMHECVCVCRIDTDLTTIYLKFS